MRICPNDKFVEIFAPRFHYLEDPFYNFFAIILLFQDTSCSLALEYSSFLFKFFSFAFYNINFWFKISKVCPKILHFSQISHSRGNTEVSYEYRYTNFEVIGLARLEIKLEFTVPEVDALTTWPSEL